MVDFATYDDIIDIQKFGYPLSITCAGAGTSLINWFHNVPGASKIMTRCDVLHSRKSTEPWVREPTPAVSEKASIIYGHKAYIDSLQYSDTFSMRPGIGVGITAALATDHKRRGDDHTWITVVIASNVLTRHFVLDKNIPREVQESCVSLFALSMIKEAIANVEKSPDVS